MRALTAEDANKRYYITGGLLVSLFGWHQRRADIGFVHKHIARPKAQLLVEYFALALPVMVGLFVGHAWVEGLGVLAAVLILPWIPIAPMTKVHLKGLRSRIPAYLFEWKSALQRTQPWIVLLGILALVFCWLPALPLFLTWVLTLMLVSQFEECESRAMLLDTARDARSLLKKKVSGSLLIMLLIILLMALTERRNALENLDLHFNASDH